MTSQPIPTPLTDANEIAKRLLKEIANVFVEQVSGLRDNVNEVSLAIVKTFVIEIQTLHGKELQSEIEHLQAQYSNLGERAEQIMNENTTLERALFQAREQAKFDNLLTENKKLLLDKGRLDFVERHHVQICRFLTGAKLTLLEKGDGRKENYFVDTSNIRSAIDAAMLATETKQGG